MVATRVPHGAAAGARLAAFAAPIRRHARLASGLVLFAFAGTHFLNHALGLVSPEAMEAARVARTAVTRSGPGTVLLLASALVHATLAVRGVLQRRTLRLRPLELVQLAFGFAIPLLLIPHVVGTRIAHTRFGVDDDYVYVLGGLWPDAAARQGLLMLLVWVHGCIGLHRWLQLEPWYRRAWRLLYAAALLVPVLGFAGFATAARIQHLQAEARRPLVAEQAAALRSAAEATRNGYIALLLGLVAYRALRRTACHLLAPVRISYVGGPTVTAAPGATLLEVSRMHCIPHASVCGGRARCSTCRVRVLEGLEHQPPPAPPERALLERVGAGPNVRLACQLRPTGELLVATLLPARVPAAGSAAEDRYFWGVERPVTILFADLRGFTTLSEHRLPYDVVFLLNQYLGQLSEAIEEHGGFVDKFLGDGVLAIFGKDDGADAGARQALAAAKAIGGVLTALNASLQHDLHQPLELGIGIHAGPAILGRIGSAAREPTRRITAIGDTVNTASRLQAQSKELRVQLVVSVSTAELAGLALDGIAERHSVVLAGKVQACEVWTVRRALDLP